MCRNFYNIFCIIILFSVSSGCLGAEKQEKANFTTIDVQEARNMILEGDIFILDVRTQEEYDAGHIMNSTLIPLETLTTQLNEIPKDKKILVYCRSGIRSAQASEILVNNGFKNVYNMNGGIEAWIKSGFETVK